MRGLPTEGSCSPFEGADNLIGYPAMMNKHHHDYKVVPYPKLRRALAVTLRSVQRTPMIHGLLEVAVTKAREFLPTHKARTGEDAIPNFV